MYASDDSDSDAHITSRAVTQGLQTVHAISGSTHTHTRARARAHARTQHFFSYL